MEDPIIGEILTQKEKSDDKPTRQSSIHQSGYWECWESLCVKGGVLYKTVGGPWEKLVLVLPEKSRKDVIRHLHDAKTAGHLGQEKIFARVRERYYWAGYYRYVVEWIKQSPKSKSHQ